MKIKKRILGFLLSLALILGLMPGMSLTAQAAWEGDPYAILLNSTTEVKFDNKDWYLIENESTAVNAGTVTLLAKECVRASNYNSRGSGANYTGSSVEGIVNTWYAGNISEDAKTAVSDGKMFLLTIAQANAITNVDVRKCSQASGAVDNEWWLGSPGTNDDSAACVYGNNGNVNSAGEGVHWTEGVRPALKLELSSVVFNSKTKTFSLPVELTTDNKPTISTTKADGNTDTKPQIGDTLTATTTAAPVTYQWKRDGKDIPGATTDTYVLTQEDLGKAITVTITQAAKTQTSEATASVVKSDAQLVGDVNTLINALPAAGDVTATHKTDIEAARAAYDALTDTQKSKVSADTLKKLTDAEAALAEALKNTGDTQQTPDGTKTVTKENSDGKTILVTNYSKTDEQISQFVFKKANGTKLDLKNVNSRSLKTVVVPATVKANGKTYKVTRIRKGFLKNCKQATKVDIGKNINTIDKNAFNCGKKVKTVIIRGKLKKVGKGAFKNTKKNVIIKVKTGEKNFEKNKALLEKSGLPKNATVKRVKNKK